MNISFVKKITSDGSLCPKCAEVQARLEKDNLMDRIDNIVIADERDPNSEGMQLAEKYNVDRAPFFIVEKENAEVEIYTIYFKFLNEVLNQNSDEKDAAKDIMDANTDLDFL